MGSSGPALNYNWSNVKSDHVSRKTKGPGPALGHKDRTRSLQLSVPSHRPFPKEPSQGPLACPWGPQHTPLPSAEEPCVHHSELFPVDSSQACLPSHHLLRQPGPTPLCRRRVGKCSEGNRKVTGGAKETITHPSRTMVTKTRTPELGGPGQGTKFGLEGISW